jgi:tetratricopeptide (TPR) repeat protein
VKVAVYTIALNEEQNVEKYLSSVAEADVVVISDTGSTDGTIGAFRAGGATVHEISVNPFRWEVARNASLALVPSDVDVCLVLDLDDSLDEGWRDALETGWGDATIGRYKYVADQLPDGSDGTTYWGNRIHVRHGYRWVHPVYELLVADRIEESTAWLDITMRSGRDQTKKRNYIEGLLLSRAESPDDPMPSRFLCRYYWGRRMWPEAEAALRSDLELPACSDRADSMRMLGDACAHRGRADEALQWWRRAVAEAPNSRQPWVSLAEALAGRTDWAGSYSAAMSALAIGAEQRVLQPTWAWRERPHLLASAAALELGMLEESQRHAELAVALAPGDQRVMANLERAKNGTSSPPTSD